MITFNDVLVVSMIEFGWDEVELAYFLGVGRSTVEHWLSGKSLPHPAMAKFFVESLLDNGVLRGKCSSGSSQGREG